MKKIVAGLVLCLELVFGAGSSYVKSDVGQFIDFSKCNQVIDKNIYSVCYDDVNHRAMSGWSIIEGSKLDKGNIKGRPAFYEDEKYSTYNVEDIQLPNHRGHTFANDNDYDYSAKTLNATYNMLNITPMHESLNIGNWRKIENKGNAIAKKVGEVISITLVEYFDTPRYDIKNYPSSFVRIYLTDDESECYRASNTDRKGDKLLDLKIDCSSLLIK